VREEVGEDFAVGHTGGQVGEYVIDGDAYASDTGFAATFAGFDGDSVLIVHGLSNGCGVCLN
jgi:hypothetical protein